MYWEPSSETSYRDIGPPVYPLQDPFDFDLVGESAEGLASGRRRSGPPGRQVRSRSNDRERKTPPKIDLVLYTSPVSEKSQRALRVIREVLNRYDASQVRFSTCDLSERPLDGEPDSVLFTPTLVKQGPGPRTSIIGNLEKDEILCELLDANGVDRRRWDD
jgi:hypothetical protein